MTNQSEVSSNPLSVVKDPRKGRCFVTNRSVKKGDVLHIARPYSVVPDMGSLKTICACCIAPPTLSTKPFSIQKQSNGASASTANVSSLPLPASERSSLPAGCHENKCSGIVYYDSRICSEQDWNAFHSYECSFLSDWKCGAIPVLSTLLPFEGQDTYTVDYTRMLIRTLIRASKEKSNNHSESILKGVDASDMSFADVWALCDNISGFQEAQLRSFTKATLVLYAFVRDYLIPSFPQLDLSSFLPRAETQYDSLIRSMYENVFTQIRNSSEFSQLPPQSVSFIFDSNLAETQSSHWQLFASLFTLICKEECNSFGLYTFAYEGNKTPRQGYGLALYPSAVYFNHSCSPNVGHASRMRPCPPQDKTQSTSFSKANPLTSITVPHMTFYALEDLSPGTEALVSYVALDTPVKQRRQDLKYYFMFDCECPRCVDETNPEQPNRDWGQNAERCPVENSKGCCGFMVPSSVSSPIASVGPLTWTCEGCGATRS